MTSLPESGGAAGVVVVLVAAFADGSDGALVAAVASLDGAGGVADGGAVDGPLVLVGSSATATRACVDVVMAHVATSRAACCARRGADTRAMCRQG
jgi:hypothetical protein